MIKKHCLIICIFLSLALFAIGCEKAPVEEIPPNEAHKKLIRIFKEEFNLNPVTKAYDNTLWVYLPLTEPFLKYASTGIGPVKSPDAQSKIIIKYLDGKYSDGNFHLKYDIGPETAYKNDRGIGSKYSQEFSVKQQHILKAIHAAYGGVDGLSDDETNNPASQAPDFFVIVIADITIGIEITMYFHINDLLRAFIDQGFGEEYARRLIVDQPIGHDKIIGDAAGNHIEGYSLSWQEFLMKQMIHRINFKYQQSAFPPSEDTRLELLSIAADTIGAYDFGQFDGIILHDLDTEITHSASKSDLAAHRSAPPTKGRLIHLKFE